MANRAPLAKRPNGWSASSPLLRLRGFAGRRPDSTVVVFRRCRDVHTPTIRHPLDAQPFSTGGAGWWRFDRLVLPGRACVAVELPGGSGALCPGRAPGCRPRRCVSAPLLRVRRKPRASALARGSDRSGNVGRQGMQLEQNQEKETSMKICPVCESTLFDDMDTCFGCLYRFGSDPALEAARSAKAVPWPVDGGEGECAASRGGEGGSAAPPPRR